MTELHPFIIQLGLDLDPEIRDTNVFTTVSQKRGCTVHEIITRLKSYTPHKHKHLYANIPQRGAFC